MPEQSKQLVPLKQKLAMRQQWLYTPKFVAQLDAALPFGPMTGARMARMIYSELQKNDKLAECSIESICGVAMACAQTGLEPGPTNQAYIIPYGGEATFQLSYRGLLTLSQNSDRIIGVAAGVVKANDPVWEWDEGSDAHIKFQRSLEEDRGREVAVFASLKTAGGGNIVRVMSFTEVEDHRRRFSKDKRDKAAWVTDWDEMAMKTVLKKACKWAPVSTETARAMEWDNRAEAGKPQKLETEIVVAEPMCVVKCGSCEDATSTPSRTTATARLARAGQSVSPKTPRSTRKPKR